MIYLRRRSAPACGFSITEMIIVVALVMIAAGIGVPTVKSMVDSMRLGMSERDVERALQTARLGAVSGNQPMRVRFNCPVVGQFRVTELIGTPAVPDPNDTATNRCDPSVYPYKANGTDNNRLTRPNNDGPVLYLQQGVTFSAQQTLEFWPDGTVHADNGSGNPWPLVPAAGTAVTLTQGGVTKSVTVYSLGRIYLQR